LAAAEYLRRVRVAKGILIVAVVAWAMTATVFWAGQVRPLETAWGTVAEWMTVLVTALAASAAGFAAWKLYRIEAGRDKEKLAEQRQAQASRVAAWWDEFRSAPVVRNGSDLPVFRAYVEFYFQTGEDGWADAPRPVALGDLAPQDTRVVELNQHLGPC
jgi:hypothetical protein